MPSSLNILLFVSHPNVTAILAAYYPRQESSNSIVHVLYGDVSASRKLLCTMKIFFIPDVLS
jgi:beta-glucosidase